MRTRADAENANDESVHAKCRQERSQLHRTDLSPHFVVQEDSRTKLKILKLKRKLKLLGTTAA